MPRQAHMSGCVKDRKIAGGDLNACGSTIDLFVTHMSNIQLHICLDRHICLDVWKIGR